jgi:hypothetical protein
MGHPPPPVSERERKTRQKDGPPANSCTAAGCMIQSTQAWNQDIVKPEYSPVTGPNSNTWLKDTAAGCGVSLPINTWGSIW